MAIDERIVTLENLGSGAAVEMFNDELQRILDNIVDPNTKPTAIREVTLKVKIKPSEDRETGHVTMSAAAKIAPVRDVATTVFIGKDDGIAVATERDRKQMTLDKYEEQIIKEGR